jgi:hypothetical protein
MTNELLTDVQAVSPNAYQVWLGQWRMNTLDEKGCLFVLRFVLSTFRSRPADDRFWSVVAEFFRHGSRNASGDTRESAKVLMGRMIMLEADQARQLLLHLSLAYASSGERLFWNTIGDAIQLYNVGPYLSSN